MTEVMGLHYLNFTANMIFIVVLAVLAYYLYQFFHLRHVEPIRTQQPLSMFTGVFFMWLCGLLVVANGLTARIISPIVSGAAIATPFVLYASSFIYIALRLYVAFNLCNSRLFLHDNINKLSKKEFERSQRWFNILKEILKFRAQVILMVFLCTVMLGGLLSVYAQHPELGTMSRYECDRDQTIEACQTLNSIGGLIALSIQLTFFIMVFRLRIVADAYGIKHKLVRLAKIFLLNWVTLIILAQKKVWIGILGSTIYTDLDLYFVAGQSYLLFMIYDLCVKPVREAWEMQKNVEVDHSSLTLGHSDTLRREEKFLLTDRGFTMFMDQLQKEFSVENLFFWKAALDFRNDPDTSTIEERARAIIDAYLLPTSPLEVNLPSEMLEGFREPQQHQKLSSVLPESTIGIPVSTRMFEQARVEVRNLMIRNSWKRFLKNTENENAWLKFVREMEEKSVIESISRMGSTMSRMDSNTSQIVRDNSTVLPRKETTNDLDKSKTSVNIDKSGTLDLDKQFTT